MWYAGGAWFWPRSREEAVLSTWLLLSMCRGHCLFCWVTSALEVRSTQPNHQLWTCLVHPACMTELSLPGPFSLPELVSFIAWACCLFFPLSLLVGFRLLPLQLRAGWCVSSSLWNWLQMGSGGILRCSSRMSEQMSWAIISGASLVPYSEPCVCGGQLKKTCCSPYWSITKP